MTNLHTILVATAMSAVLSGHLAFAQMPAAKPQGAPAQPAMKFQPPAGTPDSPQARQCVARAQQALDTCFQAIAAARSAGRQPPDCSKIAPQTYNTCMAEAAAKPQPQPGKALQLAKPTPPQAR